MASRSVEILKAIGVRGGGGGVVSRTVVEESGVVRIKILMKRQELEQVVELVSKGRRCSNKENRINGINHRQLSRSLASKSLKPPAVDDDTKKSKIVKADKMNEDYYRSHWRSALQSIPEEF